jgi:ketosteroid isomerase-like protein
MLDVGPREVVKGFFDDVNAGRLAQALERIAPDCVYHIVAPEPYGGRFDRDGMARKAGELFSCMAEPVRFEVKSIICEGPKVAVQAESHSKNAQGRAYNNRYHFLFIVRENRVVEGWEYLDSMHYIEFLEASLKTSS